MMHHNACSGLVFTRHAVGNLGRKRRVPSDRDRPFVARNEAAYEKARVSTPCHRCGYVGPSMLFRMPKKGEKGPAQLLQTSEKAFKRAMRIAKPTCLNCWGETEGTTKPRPLKGKIPDVLSTPIYTLREMGRHGLLDTQGSGGADTSCSALTDTSPLAALTTALFSEAVARPSTSSPEAVEPPPDLESKSP